jgi:hypothetical protein
MCGWPGKVPRSPAAHKKGKRRKKPTARYLIDQYREKGKGKKKKYYKTSIMFHYGNKPFEIEFFWRIFKT